jgi:D-alanine-D-alanine ligase
MRIALIFDDVDSRPDSTADERGVLEAVDAVEQSLSAIGHSPLRVPVAGRPETWLTTLRGVRPELVFNLCEGLNGSSALEPHAAALIELIGLPLTGASAETLALARRKDRVNALLSARGLPVAPWTLIRPGEPTVAWNSFPAIVKPAGEDASVGITQSSVARDPVELAAAIADVLHFGTLIIQQFVPGRELNAGIVADRVLPLAEIDFTRMPSDAWRIVSYSAKWEVGSREDLGSVPVCPAPLSSEQSLRVASIARRAWSALDGAGYGRVDFRIAEDGMPFILEVNPNPDLSPSCGLAHMAGIHGWSYHELVGIIVEEALERAGSSTSVRRPDDPALMLG